MVMMMRRRFFMVMMMVGRFFMMMMMVVAWSDDHNHDLWSPCQSIWRFGNLTGGDYGKDNDFDEEGDHFDVEVHHD